MSETTENKWKNQNGSISLFVVAIAMLVLLVIGLMFFNTKNSIVNQKKNMKEIEKQYYEDVENNDAIEQKYQEHYTENYLAR